MTIQYLRLPGVQGPPSAPVIADSLGIALGSVPGIIWLMDPDQIATDGSVLNRADGTLRRPQQTNNDDPVPPFDNFGGFGTFAGGRTSIQLTEASPTRRSVFPQVAFPTSQWSVFCHVRLTGSVTDVPATLVQFWTGGVAAPDGSQFAPRMGFSPTGAAARIWARGAFADPEDQRRLSYTPGVSYMNRAVTMMYTFSNEQGLSIWENGVRVAHEASDTQQINSFTAIGSWRWFRGVIGQVGVCGVANVDYSGASRASDRSKLFDGMSAHYA